MRRMTRGQRGSLLLHCVTLSFTTLCRSPGAFGYFHAPLPTPTRQKRARRGPRLRGSRPYSHCALSRSRGLRRGAECWTLFDRNDNPERI